MVLVDLESEEVLFIGVCITLANVVVGRAGFEDAPVARALMEFQRLDDGGVQHRLSRKMIEVCKAGQKETGARIAEVEDEMRRRGIDPADVRALIADLTDDETIRSIVDELMRGDKYDDKT